jgi:hypothetical protein
LEKVIITIATLEAKILGSLNSSKGSRGGWQTSAIFMGYFCHIDCLLASPEEAKTPTNTPTKTIAVPGTLLPPPNKPE